MIARVTAVLLLAFAVPSLAPTPAAAQQMDAISVTGVVAGHAKIALELTAGASGAPDGFVVWWMKRSDFDANGGAWYSYSNSVQKEARFTGEPTLNTFDGTVTTFQLGPGQVVRVEIGDLESETGVAATWEGELEYGTEYVLCAWALGNGSIAPSEYSNNVFMVTTLSRNCTFTQGFWKNHPNAWPVNSLMLGNVNYTKAQLLQILNNSVKGNGLVSLAHQLIATKLNIANGANAASIQAAVNAADALIGNLVVPPIGSGYLAPSTTSSTTQALDDYNNGITGPGHCDEVPTRSSTWGSIKATYR